jgi:YesN/AraC family two-component response regulator
MVKGYCRLVAKYNLKNYSLPIPKALTYISTDLTADLSLKSLANQINVRYPVFHPDV